MTEQQTTPDSTCIRCFKQVPFLNAAQHIEQNHKANEPCPTYGCPGDGRYAAPGRGHLSDCEYPLSTMSTEKEWREGDVKRSTGSSDV